VTSDWRQRLADALSEDMGEEVILHDDPDPEKNAGLGPVIAGRVGDVWFVAVVNDPESVVGDRLTSWVHDAREQILIRRRNRKA
jgi:hypothetical protein